MNESETIRDILERCKLVLKPYPHEIIVVDNSSDDTPHVAKESEAFVFRQVGSGKGGALIQGFEVAKGDIVVFLDGDGTYLPEEIPSLIEPIVHSTADVVNGNRFANMEEGAMSAVNKLGNRILSVLHNILFHTKVHDAESGMKALSKALLQRMVLRQSGFTIDGEILAEAVRIRGRIAELPITYRRRRGKTKLNPVRDGLLIAWSFITFLRDTNPLLLFGGVGLLLITAGFLVAWPVIVEYVTRGTFSLWGSALLSVTCWLMGLFMIGAGLILDAIGYSLRKMEDRMAKIAR